MALDPVLIVDNSQQRRQNLKRILQKKKVEVVEAGSCEEALETLKKQRISLILTEAELPSKSGLYLLEVVHKRFPETRVILISQNASSYNLLQALRHKAFDFIVRPIDSEEVLFTTLKRAFTHLQDLKRTSHLVQELESKNRELQKQLNLLETLNDAQCRFARTESIEELFTALLSTTMEGLKAKVGFITLFDRDSGELGIKASKGIASQLSHKLARKLPPGITHLMAQRAKPVLIPGPLPEKLTSRANEMELQNLLPGPGLLAAPLTIRDRMAGLIVLSGHDGKNPFEDGDLDFLIKAAQQAALALERAGTIHQLKQKGAPSPAPI